jgi:hypothetical protein
MIALQYFNPDSAYKAMMDTGKAIVDIKYPYFHVVYMSGIPWILGYAK